MKTRFLFPYKSRLWGYVFILSYLPVMVFKKILHHGYYNQDPTQKLADASGILNSEHILIAIAMILIMGGLLLIAFSKEKIEDEQISQQRLYSLQWAIYFNYFILIVSVIFTSNIQFRYLVMLNIWAPLIFFIISFRLAIFRLNRTLKKDMRVS